MRYFYFLICFFLVQIGYSQNDPIITFSENLIDQNKFEEAIIHNKKHLISHKNETQQILLLLGLADIYKFKLNYKIANDYYLKAFGIIKRTKNVQLEFLYYVKMAEFYRKTAKHKVAIQYLTVADVLLKKNKIDNAYLVKYYNRKAALFTEYSQNNDSTLVYATKSLKLAKIINDKDNIFYSLLEIAGVYERKQDYKTSIRYIEKIIEFAKNNGMIQQEADAYRSYVMALSRSNQNEKALEIALYAIEFSRKNNLLFQEMEFNDNVQGLYEYFGNITKAYEYSKKRHQLTYKNLKNENDKFLSELEQKYKLSEKDNQIKIKNLEILNKNRALESSNTKFYISITLFLLAISIAVFIGYFLKQTKKKNCQLHELSQENIFLLSEANHRINNNLQLIIILISDQLRKLPSNQKVELNNILKKIDSIATLHRHLYKYPDKNEIDSQKYLKDITINFNDLFKENNIETEINVDSFMIPTDFAMYLGLLFTELCINSIKHAFENQEFKQIKFDLKLVNDEIVFHYSDNGSQSINKNIQPKLVDKLCRQIKTVYEINTINGFSFSFQHKIN